MWRPESGQKLTIKIVANESDIYIYIAKVANVANLVILALICAVVKPKTTPSERSELDHKLTNLTCMPFIFKRQRYATFLNASFASIEA